MTAPQLDALDAAARDWHGTPFCARSAVRGAGVSCHRLVVEVYREAGVLPPDVQIPDGSPLWSRVQERSLIREWLDSGPGSRWFTRVPITEVQPGDLLGFRIGRCVHHLAIALRGDRIVHATEGHGARVVDHIPDTWRRRLVVAWRPT